MSRKRAPLKGDMVVAGCCYLARSGIARAIEKANCGGLQFDGELLNRILDGLLAAGHLNRAIVFAGSEFALHEDVCAFAEARRKLRKAASVCNDSVPLGFVFPLAFLVFPGARGRDRELSDGSVR